MVESCFVNRYNLPLLLAVLEMNDCKVEDQFLQKFLGLVADEHPNWIDQLNIIQIKLCKKF